CIINSTNIGPYYCVAIYNLLRIYCLSFFFQAEDGIRDSWNGIAGTIRFESRVTERAGAADPRTRPSGPAAPRVPRRAGPRDTWWRGRRPTSRRLGPRGYRLVSPR